MSTVAALLAGVELFHGLGRKELERLERVVRRRRYEAGETIVREGESGIAFYVLASGSAQVTQRGPDGAERAVRTLAPGDGFGEMALLAERPRTASITSLEPVECLVLHRMDFLDQMRQNPEIAIRMLETLSQRLLEAERRADQAAGAR
jgi:CRP/FNR family cyclic AMP-dependent transcriptional regulator